MKAMTRRQALKLAGGISAVVPLSILTERLASASEPPQVDPEGATAKALAYVHTSEIPDQLCNNCQLYTGKDDEAWGPCAIFPGQVVNAQGWCKSWIKKAG